MTLVEKITLGLQILGVIGVVFGWALKIWHTYLMRGIDSKVDKKVMLKFEELQNIKNENLEKRIEILEKHITETMTEIKEDIKDINRHMINCRMERK